jgi:hypothetical protein
MIEELIAGLVAVREEAGYLGAKAGMARAVDLGSFHFRAKSLVELIRMMRDSDNLSYVFLGTNADSLYADFSIDCDDLSAIAERALTINATID